VTRQGEGGGAKGGGGGGGGGWMENMPGNGKKRNDNSIIEKTAPKRQMHAGWQILKGSGDTGTFIDGFRFY